MSKSCHKVKAWTIFLQGDISQISDIKKLTPPCKSQ